MGDFEWIQHVFQLLPVALACISAILCAYRVTGERRRSDRLAMTVAVLCSLLLVVAQTSWWSTYLIEGNLLGTVFANSVWTIFNTLVMVTFIILAYPRPR